MNFVKLLIIWRISLIFSFFDKSLLQFLEIFVFLKDLTKIAFRETIDYIYILVRWIFRKELEFSEISLFSKNLMNVIAFHRICW